MDFQRKSSKVGILLALCAVVAGGFCIYKIMDFKIVKAVKHQSAPLVAGNRPVTECFESRVGYTTVTRVENVVPKYGYPNIKCSKTTGAVLWYGNPFDGTVPMGPMPKINDETGGNFAEAVVKPRIGRRQLG